MNVSLFADKNKDAFGSCIGIMMEHVLESNKGVKYQQRLHQMVIILIAQLVTKIQNALNQLLSPIASGSLKFKFFLLQHQILALI